MLRIAIVGAALAGFAAARALRRQSFAGEIVVIGAERHEPYDRPPLSKAFLTGACSVPDLALADPDEDLDVQWRLGATAARLDPGNRRIVLHDGTEIRADGVIVATGARARRLPGTDGLANVHTLRTLDDAIALRDALRGARRLVVIGAGFIGAEVASGARSLGLDVTVVEALPTPLAGPLGRRDGRGVRAPARRPRRTAAHRRRGRRLDRSGPGRDGRAHRRNPAAGRRRAGRDRRPAQRGVAGRLRAGDRRGRRHRRVGRDQPAGRRRHRRLHGPSTGTRAGPSAASTGPTPSNTPRPRWRPCWPAGPAAAGPSGGALLLVRPVRRAHPVRRAPRGRRHRTDRRW